MNVKNSKKRILKRVLIMPLMVCSVFLYSCKSEAQEHKNAEKNQVEGSGHDKDGKGHGKEAKGHDNDETTAMRGEHRRDKGERGEAEEDATEFGLNDTYDVTKHGVRLTLKYDKKSNSFIGVMENTTNVPITRVRVEVHLSNGTELGPTIPMTLDAKMKQNIVLKATTKKFKGWTTHAEVGNMEAGHGSNGEKGGEGREGHSKREKGEH